MPHDTAAALSRAMDDVTAVTAGRFAPEEAKKFTDALDFHLERTTKVQRLERTWRLNLAMKAGYQYHTLGSSGNLRFTTPGGPGFKAFSLHNFVQPYSDRRATTYSSFRPQYSCVPRGTDSGALSSAELSTDVLNGYWDHLRADEIWRETCAWIVGTGNGFIYVAWDKEAGDFVVDDDGKAYYEGDLRLECVPGFQIDVDPWATRWSDVRVVRRKTRRSLSWVRQKFKDKGHLVKSQDGEDDSYDRPEDDLLNIVGPMGYHSNGKTGSGYEGACTVHEYWVKSCPEFPLGRLIVRCGDTLLRDGNSPTPKGRLPFVHFRDIIAPGRLWGQSIIEQMIPLQRDYNRTRSKFLEHIVMLCNGKLIAPTAAALAEGNWISDIEVLEYAGAFPPSFLMPPSLPADLENTCTAIKRDMDDITVDFGAGRGQYQGRLSGRALDLLVEQQLKNQVPTLQAMARGLEDVATLMLAELVANVSEERVIRVVGNKKATIKAWRGEALKGTASVHIEAESWIPKSRTLAISTVQTLLMSGGLDMRKEEDKALVFELLGIDREDELIASKRKHLSAARLENALLARGIRIPPPAAWENQDVHTDTLSELLNSEEWKSLPPEMQAPALEHWEAHMRLAAPIAGVTMPPGMIEQTMAEGPSAEAGGGAGAPGGRRGQPAQEPAAEEVQFQ